MPFVISARPRCSSATLFPRKLILRPPRGHFSCLIVALLFKIFSLTKAMVCLSLCLRERELRPPKIHFSHCNKKGSGCERGDKRKLYFKSVFSQPLLGENRYTRLFSDCYLNRSEKKRASILCSRSGTEQFSSFSLCVYVHCAHFCDCAERVFSLFSQRLKHLRSSICSIINWITSGNFVSKSFSYYITQNTGSKNTMEPTLLV